MPRILVVDDEQDLCEILRFNLEAEDYEVDTAASAEEALEKVEGGKRGVDGYDLLLLDVMMGGMSGFDLARRLRESGDQTPVIFLTASGDENSVVRGLDMGADDYIAKPFRPRELVSRIRSVLRRSGKTKRVVMLGSVSVDAEKGIVSKNGTEINLSALEFRLLMAFVNHRGKLLTRNALLEEIWDAGGDFVNDNTLTVYIKRLREKIEDDPQKPEIIKTVRGLGYRVD